VVYDVRSIYTQDPIAIQLAKYLGAYVATTVSTNDKQFVQELELGGRPSDRL
jgi:hypothetical protein